MRTKLLLLTLALLAVLNVTSSASTTAFYVAPKGNDKYPGTKAKPFATLEAARDAVRDLKKSSGLPIGGVTVFIRGGVYHFRDTFFLAPEDSGTDRAPIVYRAFEGEKVLLTGGKEVKKWKAVTDPTILERLDPSVWGEVLQANLRGQGISDFDEMTRRGFGIGGTKAGLEFFFNDKPMTLARWPNDEWAKIAGVPNGPQGGKFSYDGDRPKRWKSTDDIWAHGYWSWDWAESYEKIKSINTETRVIETEPPHGVYGYTKGMRFYFLNVLEELDQPGEWYLDRKTGILYFLPPSSISKGNPVVSMMSFPLVWLQGTSWIKLRGLSMEHTRGEAVWITGGSNNLIADCRLRNIGTTAINMTDGYKNGVLSCDISETGGSAIYMDGVDRKTLTPGKCFVTNCHIYNFSRWVRTYQPGISINGVGNKVSHCLMHDAPHSAILLTGNEHIVEFNDISRVCLETGDAGAFYMGRDWTQRGNEVRYNYFHDIQPMKDVEGWIEVMSVYFDDWTSGNRIYGNLFVRAGRAVLLGGGRDNVVENNIFVDCFPSIHLDARGVGGMKAWFDDPNNTLYQRYKAIGGDKPPYSTRYPELVTMFKDEPAVPKGIHVIHNINKGTYWIDIHTPDKYDTKVLDIRDNFLEGDPGFVDPAHDDYRLRPDSPAWKIGFRAIPLDKIGLYGDMRAMAKTEQ